MAEVLAREIPGVKNAARTGGENKAVFSLGEKAISETGSYADSTLLSMLQIPFVYGSPSTAFNQLHKSEVAGIVKDFLYNTMYEPRDPLLKYNHPQWTTFLSIRIKPS